MKNPKAPAPRLTMRVAGLFLALTASYAGGHLYAM